MREEILELAQELAGEPGVAGPRLAALCERLRAGFGRFDWVGFYIADEASQVLRLGPHAGEPTEHRCIPYGRGICGQVALSGRTFIAPDVRAEANYIACSASVRSEIVLPIFHAGAFVAQLDIDSHTPAAFDPADQRFLQLLCERLSPLFRRRHIYVHGLSSSPLSKKGLVVADALAELGHPLVRPDMNLPTFEQLTLTAQVEELERLAAKLGTPFDLVGSSLGGLVSLIFATRHPDLVRRLLLIAPGLKVVGERLAELAGTTLSEWQRKGSIDMVHHSDNQVHQLGYQLVEDAARFDFDSLSPTMPTLILHGTDDEVIPVASVRSWVARRPQGPAGSQIRLVELEGGDHSLQTCFQAVRDQTREFLAGR